MNNIVHTKVENNIFQTRTSAEWLANRMAQRGHEVSVLHGAMSIENRAKIIQDFKDGVFKVLVTTNVCARGEL